ncbi:phospholipase D-like domain-containing protein [Polyangium aurulentum]|uniref:phospholipase D-like domain-containing protein n=1 Tax=Polyangium aurulentum TaxID=2567896 RepID=UPI00197E9075|nr:phospholipase D-like domain-containing protein [Polyangium aurulentum]UQA59439.1 hypothetical protein E8A73_002720 [Polyangium aurulentum]
MTPHGAPVPSAAVRLAGRGGVFSGHAIAPGCSRVVLPGRGDYELRVDPSASAGGLALRPLRAALFFDPGAGERELSVIGGLGEARSRIASIRVEDGRRRVVVVLDYVWFTPAGMPPTLGNRVELLVDGEAGWGAVAEAMREARASIRLTTWSYQPSMELLRPEPLLDPAGREANTIHQWLAARAKAGVLVQLLLWDWPLLPLPSEARRAALTAGDMFEVLTEKNPTERPIFAAGRFALPNRLFGELTIGSYHQKTVMIDGRVGFCGGMNLRENDWDTRMHSLFDPRRCRFSRPASFRKRVEGRLALADHRPRHDFMARLEGPGVAHLEENFRQRWNGLVTRGAPYAEHASMVPAPVVAAESAGGSAVQVVRTMPVPYEERGILDVYLRAIAAARKLVYIEDQFFRSTYVSEALAEAARKNPSLAVLVVTAEGQANHPITGSWSRACFERIRASLRDFELYSLRVACVDGRGKRREEEVDIHGKLLLVDDELLMVGSCNVHDRGFEYEGECNLAVVDPALVSRIRLGLFEDYLGGDRRLGGGIAADVALFREHAAMNARRPPDDADHPYLVPFTPRSSRFGFFDRGVF